MGGPGPAAQLWKEGQQLRAPQGAQLGLGSTRGEDWTGKGVVGLDRQGTVRNFGSVQEAAWASGLPSAKCKLVSMWDSPL